jgi:hypothetical protein
VFVLVVVICTMVEDHAAALLAGLSSTDVDVTVAETTTIEGALSLQVTLKYPLAIPPTGILAIRQVTMFPLALHTNGNCPVPLALTTVSALVGTLHCTLIPVAIAGPPLSTSRVYLYREPSPAVIVSGPVMVRAIDATTASLCTTNPANKTVSLVFIHIPPIWCEWGKKSSILLTHTQLVGPMNTQTTILWYRAMDTLEKEHCEMSVCPEIQKPQIQQKTSSHHPNMDNNGNMIHHTK